MDDINQQILWPRVFEKLFTENSNSWKQSIISWAKTVVSLQNQNMMIYDDMG